MAEKGMRASLTDKKALPEGQSFQNNIDFKTISSKSSKTDNLLRKKAVTKPSC
ncbi:hypothetical protein [uncultured Bartonella sp.]|uniref:hypothetical protein n=1 Tax=uncultured Bartonella sp. TaxID=104108 RepID=UPI002621FDA1|nr:hypothetical protein [uncultured Bartonella sp.]